MLSEKGGDNSTGAGGASTRRRTTEKTASKSAQAKEAAESAKESLKEETNAELRVPEEEGEKGMALISDPIEDEPEPGTLQRQPTATPNQVRACGMVCVICGCLCGSVCLSVHARVCAVLCAPPGCPPTRSEGRMHIRLTHTHVYIYSEGRMHIRLTHTYVYIYTPYM